MGTKAEKNKTRLEELDYLKCIFILLMITFHLAYIGDGYPYMKRFVYTFHMPGFLVISGYLMNIRKSPKAFGRSLLGIVLPYIVMESGYTIMASILPIRDHIDHLTPALFADKLLLHPLGPYWYLHTLMICGAVYYMVFQLKRASLLSKIIIIALAYYMLSSMGIMSFPCAMYFLGGLTICNSGIRFTEFFRPSWLAFLPLTLLFLHEESHDKAIIGGMIIVYCVISLALAIYIKIPNGLQKKMLFLGRNSLSLYIFSPIFTILCKPFIPFLAFDDTRLLFLLLSLPICVAGSLAIGRLTGSVKRRIFN